MWLIIELPDECRPDVDKFLEWYNTSADQLSGEGTVMTIFKPSRPGDIKLAARIKEVQVP